MTFQTPGHGEWFVLMNDFHFIDSTMAGNATDAMIDVSGMIEKHEVRLVVNLQPRDWHAA